MNRKAKNGIKVLIATVIAIALIAPISYLTALSPAFDNGPSITFGPAFVYEGPAPPIDYHGPVEDYVGPMYDATWITPTTNINISMKSDILAPWCFIQYRIWDFLNGFGNWVSGAVGQQWINTDLVAYDGLSGSPPKAHDCLHKIEARLNSATYGPGNYSWAYFYVDGTPPVTTKEYGEPICYPDVTKQAVASQMIVDTPPAAPPNPEQLDVKVPGVNDFPWDCQRIPSGAHNAPNMCAVNLSLTWAAPATITIEIWEWDGVAGWPTWLHTESFALAGSMLYPTVPPQWVQFDFSAPIPTTPANWYYINCYSNPDVVYWWGDASPVADLDWTWENGVMVDAVAPAMDFGFITYTMPDTIPCITNDTPIYLNCTDGEWNINEDSCPVGVNGTFFIVRHTDNGNDTGVLFASGSHTVITMTTLNTTYGVNSTWDVFEDCNHTIEYWQVDWLGNEETPHVQDFYLDNTPPDVYIDVYAEVELDCEVCCGQPYEFNNTLFYENFEAGIPGTWSIALGTGTGSWAWDEGIVFWTGNPIGSGHYAGACSACHPADIFDTNLSTPALDLSLPFSRGEPIYLDYIVILQTNVTDEFSTWVNGKQVVYIKAAADDYYYTRVTEDISAQVALNPSATVIDFKYSTVGDVDQYGVFLDDVHVFSTTTGPGIALYYEVIPDPENESLEIEVMKQKPGGCFNITAYQEPTGCCTNDTLPVPVLKVYGPDYDPDTVPVKGYWEFNMTSLGGGHFYYEFCNTSELGLYTFEVEAKDCLGNINTTVYYGLVKYLCDVDVVELITPDPSIWHAHMPTEVEVRIKNNGILSCPGPINVHLQIYEEQPFDLVDWYCSDEGCILNTWEVYSWDGDPVSWVWTEKRSFTPTHSWHCIPDYMDYYEAYSHDSLILTNHSATGLYIPEETADGEKVYVAMLNFSTWCEGEEFYDYGNVYIMNSTDGITWDQTQLNADSWFDTDGEWEYCSEDSNAVEEGFDISEYIGQYVKINFTWFSDALVNYEGWYIDDVCIRLQYGALQPLVYQQYKYVYWLNQTEEKIIEFPLDFEPKNDTWYFFEVYSDLCGDYDGRKDNEYVLKTDPRSGFEYKDPLNGVNESIYFGDVCDAAITDISMQELIEMPILGVAEIPIDVTVCNTGTLTEDVPVKVSARAKVYETLYKDDMEDHTYYPGSEDWPEDETYDAYWDTLYAGGDTNEWNWSGYNFFSPYNSMYYGDHETHNYNPGGYGYVMYEIKGFDWDYARNAKNFDIKAKVNANVGDDMLCAALRVGNTYYRMVSARFVDGEDVANRSTGGWIEISFFEELERYIESPTRPEIHGGNIIDLIEWYAFDDGLDGLGDWAGFGFCMCGSDYYGLNGGYTGDWSGALIDDMEIYIEYEGEEVWSDIKVVEDLEQGECEDLTFWWNTTEYCDYIVTAEVLLDCDQNASNNNMSTTTRIYEQIYTDIEEFELDDNTCGPDHWHLVEECSMCPDDHFWYCGDEEDTDYGYGGDWRDCLYINEVFNWSDPTITNVTISFDTYYAVEDGDYCYLDISNDSGLTWFNIDSFTGNNVDWEHVSYFLNPGHTPPQPTKLYSEYTDFEFDLPSDFFTEDMHIRFRFVSDDSNDDLMKGWFVDNVKIDVFNGTWYTNFSDTMEDAVSSNENWTHTMCCFGSHWHNETVFGDSPYSAKWFWNGEARLWSEIGASLVNSTYDWDPLPAWWNYWENDPTHTLGEGYEYVSGAGIHYWTIDVYADGYEAYMNQSNVALPVSPQLELHFGWWTYQGNDGDPTAMWVETDDGTTTIRTRFTRGSWGGDTFETLPLPATYSGKTINVSFHWNETTFNDPKTFGVSEWQLFNVEFWAFLPGLSLPYENYYNNVDEKIVFEMNLTKAYEAIVSWAQNFSFANMYDDDYGVVEIWTGTEWKALFIVQGDSGGKWGEMALDISEYTGGDENTLFRFRFISNETMTDYGWLIDYVSVEGKLDNVPPEVIGALDPSQPDGCHDWYVSAVTVKLTATDNVKVDAIYYRIDGGVWLTYTAPFTITVDGEHTVDYYAVDEVGNEADIETLTFKIDTTNPTGSITVPQAGYIYLFGRELMPRILIRDKALIIGGLTATATATDATSGVDYVTFTTGAGSANIVSPYNFNLPFYFPFGSDTLTISVTDEACNTASNVASVDYFKIL